MLQSCPFRSVCICTSVHHVSVYIERSTTERSRKLPVSRGSASLALIRSSRSFLGLLQRQLIEDLETSGSTTWIQPGILQPPPRSRLDHNSIFPVLFFCREGSDDNTSSYSGPLLQPPISGASAYAASRKVCRRILGRRAENVTPLRRLEHSSLPCDTAASVWSIVKFGHLSSHIRSVEYRLYSFFASRTCRLYERLTA